LSIIESPDIFDEHLSNGTVGILSWIKCERYFRIEPIHFFVLLTIDFESAARPRKAIIDLPSIDEVYQFLERYEHATEELQVAITLGMQFRTLDEFLIYQVIQLTTPKQ
jgi:hypothetical protein